MWNREQASRGSRSKAAAPSAPRLGLRAAGVLSSSAKQFAGTSPHRPPPQYGTCAKENEFKFRLALNPFMNPLSKHVLLPRQIIPLPTQTEHLKISC